jgi:tetratricopeptide (TPR) repeat protein
MTRHITLVVVLLFLLPASRPAGGTGQGISSAADYLRQGQSYLDQKDYRQARQAAREALRLDPRSAEAENLLGTAEYGLGNPGIAQEHLQRALELDSGLIAARRTLAAIFLKQRRLADARRNFELVLAAEPRDLVSLYSLGLISLLDGQPAAALEQFAKALKLKPGDPTVLLGRLEAQLKMKQKPQAAATLQELEAGLGDRDLRRTVLATLLVSQGAYDLAVPEFERLRAIDPNSHETNYNLALAYHRAGKEAEASALLESLLARQEDAEFEDLLGEVRESRGHQAQALEAFRRAVQLEPRNEDYRFDYAHALVGQGAMNRALEVFAAAAKDFPRSLRMWLGWGATYYLAGKYQEAAQTLLGAAEIAPQAPEVYYLLGRAYDAAGPLQGAIAERFAAYLKNAPQDAWAQYFYGRILRAGGEANSSDALAEAQQRLEAAIRLDPSLAEARVELGHVLEMRGRLEAARAELERAVQIDPRSSAAYYRLAQVYRQLGEPGRAQDAAQKFQQLKAPEGANPDRERIRVFLERGER